MYDPLTGAYLGDPNAPWTPPGMEPEDARRHELARQFYDPDTGKFVGNPDRTMWYEHMLRWAPVAVAGGFAAAGAAGAGAAGGAASGGGVPSIAAGGVASGVPAGALGTATTLGGMATPSMAAGMSPLGYGMGGSLPGGVTTPSIAAGVPGGVATGVPAGAMGPSFALPAYSGGAAVPSIAAGGVSSGMPAMTTTPATWGSNMSSLGPVGTGVPSGAMGQPLDPAVVGGSAGGFSVGDYLKDKFKDPQTYFDIAGMIGSIWATKKQQQGVDKALELQQQMYEQTRADLGPYREIGGRAMTTLGGMMGLGGIGPPVEAAPALGPGSGQRTRSPDAVDTGKKAVRRGTVPPPGGGGRGPDNVGRRDPIMEASTGYGQVMLPSGEVVTVPTGTFADELAQVRRRAR